MKPGIFVPDATAYEICVGHGLRQLHHGPENITIAVISTIAASPSSPPEHHYHHHHRAAAQIGSDAQVGAAGTVDDGNEDRCDDGGPPDEGHDGQNQP